MTKILEHGIIKILGIVDGYLLRDSIETDDVFLEKFLNSGRGYIGCRFCFNPLGEVLDCYNGEGVVSLGWCEFAHDIDTPSLQRP
jgi:hypothetical protein